MSNVEGNYDIDSDTDGILDEARPYYFSICIFLFWSGFYLIAVFYAVFGICLIGEDEDEERTEFEYIDPAIFDGVYNNYYEKYGFSVVGETLVDYLETISLDPQMSSDLPMLNEFFLHLDDIHLNLNNISNLLLADIEYDTIKDGSFYKQQSTKFTSDTNDKVAVRERQFKKLQGEIMFTKLEILGKSAYKNKKDRIRLRNQYKNLAKMQENLQEDLREYQISAEVHNVFLVGYYMNSGLYPISNYDCERALLKGTYSFNFDEYFLFEYEYFFSELNEYDYFNFGDIELKDLIKLGKGDRV